MKGKIIIAQWYPTNNQRNLLDSYYKEQRENRGVEETRLGAFKHVAVLLAMLSSRDINAKPPTMIRPRMQRRDSAGCSHKENLLYVCVMLIYVYI